MALGSALELLLGPITEWFGIGCLRPGAVAGRTNPMSKEPWLSRCRRA